MLVVTKIEKNDYVVLKLSNNEEVIGKLIETNDNEYVINRPRVLVANTLPDGKQSIGLGPYIQLGIDGDVPMNRNHVVAIMKVHEELKKDYIKILSGLEL